MQISIPKNKRTYNPRYPVTLTVKVSPETLEKILTVAEFNNVTKSNTARFILEDFFAKYDNSETQPSEG